jgi:hypothetical protein
MNIVGEGFAEEIRKQIVEIFPAKFYLFDKRSESKTVILDKEFYFANNNANDNTENIKTKCLA